jgi:hypothetical protein
MALRYNGSEEYNRKGASDQYQRVKPAPPFVLIADRGGTENSRWFYMRLTLNAGRV